MTNKSKDPVTLHNVMMEEPKVKILRTSAANTVPHRTAYEAMTDDERRALLATALRLRMSPEGSVGPTIGMILGEALRIDDLMRHHADPKLREIACRSVEAALRSAVDRFDLVDPGAMLHALDAETPTSPRKGVRVYDVESKMKENDATATQSDEREPVASPATISRDCIDEFDIRNGRLGKFRLVNPALLKPGYILLTMQGDAYCLTSSVLAPDPPEVFAARGAIDMRWIRIKRVERQLDPDPGGNLLSSYQISEIDVRDSTLRGIPLFERKAPMRDGQVLVTRECETFVFLHGDHRGESFTDLNPDGQFVLRAFGREDARWVRAAADGGPPILPDMIRRADEPVGYYLGHEPEILQSGEVKTIQIRILEPVAPTHLAIADANFRILSVAACSQVLVNGSVSAALFLACFDGLRPVTRGGRLPRIRVPGESMPSGSVLSVTALNPTISPRRFCCTMIGNRP